jgi:hypothetical protein
MGVELSQCSKKTQEIILRPHGQDVGPFTFWGMRRPGRARGTRGVLVLSQLNLIITAAPLLLLKYNFRGIILAICHSSL